MPSPAPKFIGDGITSTQVPNSLVDSTGEQPAVEALDQETYQAKDVGSNEEERECGFCVFMKGGECGDSFTAWEICIKEAELNSEDCVDKCADVTAALGICMETHADYYGPVLRAQRAVDEAAQKVLSTEHHSQENPHPAEGDGDADEEEEEAESEVHSFMKGGECRDSVVAWKNCIREAELNKEKIFDKCMDVTATLRECVDAHSDHHEATLHSEKMAEDEARKEP